MPKDVKKPSPKSIATSNKKEEWATIDFECDKETMRRLKAVSKMSRASLDVVISVLLAVYFVYEAKTLPKKKTKTVMKKK